MVTTALKWLGTRAPQVQLSANVPTPNERKALWFLALVTLSGSGVRIWRAQSAPVPAADAGALAHQIKRVDSARAVGASRRSTPKPKGRDTIRPIDLDRATAAEIEELPGIGPTLAQRIVASRDSQGTFGDLEALCEVRGVGPALMERLRPLVTFTGARRPVSVACGGAFKRTKKARASRGS
jgi:competence ComEA-like helix-hairpin-helix protein